MKIEIDEEYSEALEFWYDAALEESDKDGKEFHKMLIYGWSVESYPEDDDILSIFKSAEKRKDYTTMQQLFYTFN